MATWKGLKLRHQVKAELIESIMKDTFYQYNMGLKAKISDAMDKYAAHVQKLSKAARKKL